MDQVAELEDRLQRLVDQGRAAAWSSPARLELSLPVGQALGFTQPAHAGGLNTDNVLVDSTFVGGVEALVVAVAHGNYKDEGCSFAAAAAICEVHQELSKPLLSLADVAPALRRALLKSHACINGLATAAVGGRRWGTAAGARRSLRGIGASLVAAIVTQGFVSVAHVGENRALLVHAGRPLQLVLPHTLRYAPGHAAALRAATDSSSVVDMSDIVMRVVGCGSDDLPIDLVRAPIADGDRLVLGNAGIGVMLDAANLAWTGARAEMIDAFVMASVEQAVWLPPTLIIADVRVA